MRRGLFGIMLAALLALLTVSGALAQDGEPLRIGLLTDESGNLAIPPTMPASTKRWQR
jgi:hypothetical protein